MIGRLVVAALVGVLLLAPAAEAAKKPPVYRVKMTFKQVRPWTYHNELSVPGCVRTDDGDGQTVVKLHGTGLLTATNLARTGIGAVGTNHQTGTFTHTVSGAECAASATFPTSWSIVTQTAGTVTATEPTTGCGTLKPKVSFPALTLVGKRLVLEWDGTGGLEFDAFDPCPYFDGSNQATSGKARLPGREYRDLVAKITHGAPRSGARRVVARGTSTRSAEETCANIVEGCAEGVTYDATATVTSTVKLVLTRLRH